MDIEHPFSTDQSNRRSQALETSFLEITLPQSRFISSFQVSAHKYTLPVYPPSLIRQQLADWKELHVPDQTAFRAE